MHGLVTSTRTEIIFHDGFVPFSTTSYPKGKGKAIDQVRETVRKHLAATAQRLPYVWWAKVPYVVSVVPGHAAGEYTWSVTKRQR